MIRRFWLFSGRLLYWLIWPMLFVYVRGSRRTRVLVICGDEVLTVRGWLGSGKLQLPGGGLHRGEKPESGAIRELAEETGLELKPAQLRTLLSDFEVAQNGLTYRLYAFAVVLERKPVLVRQRFEIAGIQWISFHDLEIAAIRDNSADVRKVLAAFAGK